MKTTENRFYNLKLKGDTNMNNSFINNQRGLTLIQLMFILAAIIAISTITIASLSNANKAKAEAKITTNISQLESAAKTYFMNKNAYPVKEALNIGDSTEGTHMKTFFKELKTISGFTEETINKRIKLVDIKTLQIETYITQEIEDPEDYVLDKKTGKVYNISSRLKLEEIIETIERLIADAGDVLNLTKGEELDLEKDGKRMNQVHATVAQDNKIILGGDGTMKLAIITVSEDGSQTVMDLEDYTSKMTGTAPEAVTELRLIDKGKVLVHYYDGEKLEYLTLHF